MLSPALHHLNPPRRGGPALILLVALFAAGGVAANDVMRWTDENGVTHFGSPQFAPTEAESVDVEPANGMAVPSNTGDPLTDARGPTFTKLEMAPKKNPRGWRQARERPRSRGVSIRQGGN